MYLIQNILDFSGEEEKTVPLLGLPPPAPPSVCWWGNDVTTGDYNMITHRRSLAQHESEGNIRRLSGGAGLVRRRHHGHAKKTGGQAMFVLTTIGLYYIE